MAKSLEDTLIEAARAMLAAEKETACAYQFAPNSFTHSAIASGRACRRGTRPADGLDVGADQGRRDQGRAWRLAPSH